jgi:hypothetical protein
MTSQVQGTICSQREAASALPIQIKIQCLSVEPELKRKLLFFPRPQT